MSRKSERSTSSRSAPKGRRRTASCTSSSPGKRSRRLGTGSECLWTASPLIGRVMKAGIVGVGKVGGAVGFALAREGPWDELILVDAVPDLAWAQAAATRPGLRVSTQPTVRVGKIDDLADCDVVVLSAGQGGKPGITRLDLLHANAGLVAELSRDIARAARRASLVVLTNPMGVLTTGAGQSTGWPRTRGLGSGTPLDSQRFRMVLADRPNVPSFKVSATVLGQQRE